MKATMDEAAADHPQVFFIGIEQPQECQFACKHNLAGVVFAKTNSALCGERLRC